MGVGGMLLAVGVGTVIAMLSGNTHAAKLIAVLGVTVVLVYGASLALRDR